MPIEDLPVAEFAFPGPLRDQLVAAILDGSKTTTTGLLVEYEREAEPLPEPVCAPWPVSSILSVASIAPEGPAPAPSQAGDHAPAARPFRQSMP